MYFDEEHGLFLPLTSRGIPGHSVAEQSVTGGPEAGSGWERLRRKAVPVTLGCGICAALVTLTLLVSSHVPPPYGAILPGLPVFFLGPIVDLLDSRKVIFPTRDLPWRTVLGTAFYTASLVIALNVEGAALKAATGSDSGLEILNLATAIAMGALIGWRTPRLALWTILETSFAGSVLGVVADLSFLGWRGFQQVHPGAPLAVVMIETGLLFEVAGLAGYFGLKAVRKEPRQNSAERGDGTGVPSRQPLSAGAARQKGVRGESRGRTAIALSAICLIFLVGIASYGFGYARAGNALPAPAIYPVQRQIAQAGGVILSLTGVEVRPAGDAVFAVTYLNTSLRAVGLSCAGYADPAAATIELSDGRVYHSDATFCSVHPESTRTIGAGKSIISYAQFPDARGLDQSFTFDWHSGLFSGTLSGLSLSTAAVR